MTVSNVLANQLLNLTPRDMPRLESAYKAVFGEVRAALASGDFEDMKAAVVHRYLSEVVDFKVDMKKTPRLHSLSARRYQLFELRLRLCRALNAGGAIPFKRGDFE